MASPGQLAERRDPINTQAEEISVSDLGNPKEVLEKRAGEIADLATLHVHEAHRPYAYTMALRGARMALGLTGMTTTTEGEA